MKDSSLISLRKLNPSDKKFLFNLRNQPNVYEYSINKRPVEWEEHEKWFLSILKKKNIKLFTIQKSRNPIGQIKFDFEDFKKAKISISILKSFRNHGIATEALKSAIDKIKRENKIKSLIAIVHKKNIPSQKLFEKLNFRQEKKKGQWLIYSFKL